MTTTKHLENRISVGSRVYHMTNANALAEIKKSGLLPLTSPNWETAVYVRGFSSLVDLDNRKYVVCGIAQDFSDWKNYGLFNSLDKHVGSKSKSPKIIVSFELEQSEGILVLEHAHMSPKRFIELCGKDLWAKSKNGFRRDSIGTWCSQKDLETYCVQEDFYKNSRVKLENYDGGFKLPELWIPQTIPFDKLTIEEVIQK